MRRADSPWEVGIVIPAHDEEETVAGCTDAVLRAVRRCEVQAHVVVVADGCRDRTAERARDALGSAGEVLVTLARRVGSARRAGTERVLSRMLQTPRSRQWLLHTDADTIVPPDWIVTHLGFARRGAAAVAGIVSVDSFEDHGWGASRRFYETYELREDGTHPHVHGANMGVRADVYITAGGWRDVALSEDHCLWNRLRTHGYPTVSTSLSTVTTSGRPYGRAPGGFADTLRRVCAAGGGSAS